MDIVQVFISSAEWVFFPAWVLVVVVISIVAFGRDIAPGGQRTAIDGKR